MSPLNDEYKVPKLRADIRKLPGAGKVDLGREAVEVRMDHLLVLMHYLESNGELDELTNDHQVVEALGMVTDNVYDKVVENI